VAFAVLVPVAADLDVFNALVLLAIAAEVPLLDVTVDLQPQFVGG
jgi:hypothetical protein